MDDKYYQWRACAICGPCSPLTVVMEKRVVGQKLLQIGYAHHLCSPKHPDIENSMKYVMIIFVIYFLYIFEIFFMYFLYKFTNKSYIG